MADLLFFFVVGINWFFVCIVYVFMSSITFLGECNFPFFVPFLSSFIYSFANILSLQLLCLVLVDHQRDTKVEK